MKRLSFIFLFLPMIIFMADLYSAIAQGCLEPVLTGCKKMSGSLKEIGFAPVKRIQNKKPYKWSFKFINGRKNYKNNTYNLENKESVVSLENLSKGIQFPVFLNGRIRYNHNKKVLIFKGVMKDDERRCLLNLSGVPAYREAIKDLYRKSLMHTIWFYSSLQKDKKGNLPEYIWHLIATPAPEYPQQFDAEGYLINLTGKACIEYSLVTHKEYSLLQESKIPGTDILTNNNIPQWDDFTFGKINELWNRLLTGRNMKPVYCERDNKKELTGYDYTFYFHKRKVDKDRVSLETGYRIPSSKVISTPGTVYGFVFNKSGYCLGFDTLVVK